MYITRQNTNYRKILNESDVIKLFKKNNFQIVNPSNYEIKEQINSIHGPIGIKLGGRSAPEIALSIIAQLVSETYKK